MAIDFDIFLEWAKDYFGEENIKIRHTSHGDEICAHSPFSLSKLGKFDNKYHLWMNPEGGKKRIEEGAYRCWLTDSMGSLVSLVSECDNIPYEEAEELLEASLSLRKLEQKALDFFGYKDEATLNQSVIEEVKVEMEFPAYTYPITGNNSRMAIIARQYLRSRKLPYDDLYICTQKDENSEKDYSNRIIIPYYNRFGERYWWNARTLSTKEGVLRYMKPAEGNEDEVLYVTCWPNRRSKIYIMEGEFDAKTVDMAGFIAAACGGKYLSDAQIELIRGHIPVLAFDADESGKEALINVGKQLLSVGFGEMYYVRPPVVYKDWNKLMEKRNIQTVKAYINHFEKPLTSIVLDQLLSSHS